ncbi:unnamed protein product [Effrenium voratum]|nr:unnamed protein product [Effrenium voratum]
MTRERTCASEFSQAEILECTDLKVDRLTSTTLCPLCDPSNEQKQGCFLKLGQLCLPAVLLAILMTRTTTCVVESGQLSMRPFSKMCKAPALRNAPAKSCLDTDAEVSEAVHLVRFKISLMHGSCSASIRLQTGLLTQEGGRQVPTASFNKVTAAMWWPVS